MACHKPCVFKLWKNKRECLYSVKSSIGTEPTESKLAHSRLNQFGKELRMKFCWMKQRSGTACQQFHNCRYVEMASHLYITDEGKRLRWCQTFQHPWHPLQKSSTLKTPKQEVTCSLEQSVTHTHTHTHDSLTKDKMGWTINHIILNHQTRMKQFMWHFVMKPLGAFFSVATTPRPIAALRRDWRICFYICGLV